MQPPRIDKKLISGRGWVRIVVTYIAAVYLFGVGGWLVWMIIFAEQTTTTTTENNVTTTVTSGTSVALDNAANLFLALAPTATAIVTYWFVDRAATKRASLVRNGSGNDESGEDD